MVDIIDLLDDSSDDEIESRPTVTKKPSVTQSDDDNEVLWMPTPIARSSSSNKNKITQSTQKRPPINFNRCKDNEDGDVEILVVDPQHARKRSSPTIDAKRSNEKPSSSMRRSSVLDSDDESDDDFLFSSLSSGLSRTQCKGPGKTPSKSWRSQAQLNTSSARKKVETPIVSNGVAPCGTNSSGRKPIRNPYAKTKTPPSQSISSGATQQSSAKNRSTSSSGIDWRSPSVTKSRTIMKNPYSSSGNKSGTTRSANSMEAAAAARQELTCTVRPPKLRVRTKTYPDLRPNIVLALWKYARKNLVRDSYQGKRLDQFIGRIVDLVVSAPDFPIRSMGEYAIRKRGHMSKRGCGGLTISGDSLPRFEKELQSTGVMETRLSNFPGKYFSISEACLVAMKDAITNRWKAANQTKPFPADERSQTDVFSQKEFLISLEELIPLIDNRLRPECPSRLQRNGEADKGASYYLSSSTRSAEFKQIEKLVATVDIPKANGSIHTTSYLKKRTVRGRQHYQLMPLGFQKACMISKRILPATLGPYRFCNLHSVQPKFERICLAVDFREGGSGDRYHKVLHTMCNRLDLLKIPYCVNTLRIGDYCFFSGDKLCPILVERKSIEDVAKSIDTGDGRWITQKARMYQGQYVFGYQNCRMAYIIEGKLEKELVSNNYVANARHKVSKERFEQEVANLEDEGFEVIRTCSVKNSMLQLSRWAESVAIDIQSGKLPLKYTYDEFLREVDKIPKNVDFSHLAKYHASKRKAAKMDLLSDEDSYCGHEGKLSPLVLDERFRGAEKRPVFNDTIQIKSGQGTSKRFKLNETKCNYNKDRFARDAECKSDSSEKKNEYTKWTAAALRDKCEQLGMKKTGSKAEMIERLLDTCNHPPAVYCMRKQRNLYVPANLATAPTAILVAIQIEQDNASIGAEKYGGMTKDEIYIMAEKIDVTKNPFCGGSTQTGPYRKYLAMHDCSVELEHFSMTMFYFLTLLFPNTDYDGWSSMSTLKQSGDPPLVVEKKQRFRLSTTGDVSGLQLARGMHIWCHKKGICKCTEHGYEFDPRKWK